MAPEVLIVGDPTRRSELLRRVQRLGYEAVLCSDAQLRERVERGVLPAAVLVCTEDVEPRALMTALRGARHGVGVPVTLHGPLGGRIDDLADVLDLGADLFLEAPADDEQLASALHELAGPSAGRVVTDPRVRARPTRPSAPATVAATSDESSAVLGHLHQTLDRLEARLRQREHEGDADDIDLASLGFEALPDVGQPSQPAEPSVSSLELLRSRPRAPGPRRIRTERLQSEQASASARVPSSARRPVTRSLPAVVKPPPVPIAGSLSGLPVPRLLWVLHRAEYEGAVTLRRDRVEKRLWWRAGALSFVESNVGNDRLVDGLLRRGLLTRSQYEGARATADAEPRRAAARLLQAGFLKKSEAPRVLRRHLASVVDSMFGWNEGSYELHPGERCDGRGLEATPVARLVAHGVRQRLEPQRLAALLGDLDARPRFVGDAQQARELAEPLQLSPSELAWVSRFDGRRSLRQWLAQPQTDELELLGLVYTLHTIEQLELSSAPTSSVETADPAQIDRQRIIDRLQQSREGDYFAILGLGPDASRVDVRRAYVDLRRTFGADALEPEVREAMRTELIELRDLIDEARDVLIDESLRSAYLAHREESDV